MTEIDSDAEPDSSPNRPAPQTPPRNAKVTHYPWSHHASTTPKSSPPASPSLSLYSLGVSPLSPMRRQFSSSLTRSSSLHPPEPDHSEQDDLVQDSKDVLVQRLNDLATQLSQQDHLKEDSVYGLHAKVDEMERVLSRRDHPLRQTPQRSRPTSLIQLQSSKNEHERFWGSLSPGRIIPSISNVPLPTQKSSSTQTSEEYFDGHRAHTPQKNQMSAAQAARVVEEAQRLNKELEDVTTSLRARQEESDARSHPVAYTKRAAQRIIQLEKRIKELERERNEGEMEMLNLQIQLKAIEVQCLSYVPEDADEELRESISAWKTEWSALKRKRARRKAGSGEDIGAPGTPSRQPRNTTFPG
ncbi:hypothetical protein F4776DRAFT_676281 [Hypoxylon sp. NC0597]|nr:hypothetical protein F4776DRAFT_676281 [Hypoxylon sp. NC0597]